MLDRVGATDEDAAFRPFAFETAGDMQVSGGDHRNASVLVTRARPKLVVEGPYRPRYRRSLALVLQRGEAGRGRVRHRKHVCSHFSRDTDWDEVSPGVDHAIATAYAAQDMDVERLQQRMRCLKAGGSVVVAGHDDRGHCWPSAVQGHQGFVKQPLRGTRWVLGVVDVAGHDEQVDFTLGRDANDIVEDGLVLAIPSIPPEGLSDVPVARVQDPHRRSFPFRS